MFDLTRVERVVKDAPHRGKVKCRGSWDQLLSASRDLRPERADEREVGTLSARGDDVHAITQLRLTLELNRVRMTF